MELKIKTKMRYHFTPIKMAIYKIAILQKNKEINNLRIPVGTQSLLVEMQNGTATVEKYCSFL